MRTARGVIVFLLFFSAAAGISAQQSTSPAQGSVDTDVTVVGRDDGIIPIPEPEGSGDEVVLPTTDIPDIDPVLVAPVRPPAAEPPRADASWADALRAPSEMQ
jgi:hypothetical protein